MAAISIPNGTVNMVRLFGAKTLVLIAMAASMTTAGAEEREVSFDTFGDWRAVVTSVTGGDETWRVCRAATGGDGDPVLEIRARQYDAGPPVIWPNPMVIERAPRGYDTLMQDGAALSFVFDDGERFSAVAVAEFDEQGFRVAVGEVFPAAPVMVLRAMYRGATLDINVGTNTLFRASLRGFTAAYFKIAEACEFSPWGLEASLSELEAATAGQGITFVEAAPEVYTTGHEADEGVLHFAEHGVWQIVAEEFENEGSMILECHASTRHDGPRRLSFSHNTLEAVPPDSYPPLVLSESIPENAAPMATRGAPLRFVYDSGLVLPGEVMTDTSHERARYIDIAVSSGYRDIALREMSRARTLWVYNGQEIIFQTRLNGFAETYADMARVCAFTSNGVLD